MASDTSKSKFEDTFWGIVLKVQMNLICCLLRRLSFSNKIETLEDNLNRPKGVMTRLDSCKP